MPVDVNCVLPRPDIGELHRELAAEFSQRLLGGAPVVPNSTEDVLSFVMAGTTNLFFGAVAQAVREHDPAEACCDNLVYLASNMGLPLRSATRTKGYVRLTGTPGAVIPETIRLVTPGGAREYKIDLAVRSNPRALDSLGEAALRVVAALPGAFFNVEAGTVLMVATTTNGINMEAVVIGNGLTGGGNDEECEDLRARLIAAQRNDIIVANEAWFLRESAAYPGVTRVCTEECGVCCETSHIALYPFFEGIYPPYGVPPAGVLDEMTSWMFGPEPGRGQGKAPFGMRGAYLCAHPVYIDVTARCFTGCEIGVEERITAALTGWLRDNTCVGSTICIDQMKAALYQALGPGPCLADVQFSFGEGVRFIDAANAFLDCGMFAVMGNVEVSTGP